jgi:hypothetical protein
MEEGKMSDNLKAFLTQLSTNSGALAAFKDSPKAALDAAHLSDSEKVAVLSGDTNKLRTALGGSTTASTDISVTLTIKL